MLLKIGSVLIVLSVSYVLGVFFAPAQTDEIGKVLGISEFNQTIRDAKAKLDGLTDTVSKIKDQSGGVIDTAEQNLKNVQNRVTEVKDTVQATKETIETKVNQGKQIIDTASSLKEQIDTFTTLSGSMASASGSVSASGSITASGARTDSGSMTTPSR